MNANHIEIENGIISVGLATASVDEKILPLKTIQILIGDCEVRYNGEDVEFISELTELQALKIAEILIGAVLADKNVSDKEKEEHWKLIEKHRV